MTPEAKARLQIDQKLQQAGWEVQSLKEINLGAGRGVAVREYPTDTGPADYVLFVDRTPIHPQEPESSASTRWIFPNQRPTDPQSGALGVDVSPKKMSDNDIAAPTIHNASTALQESLQAANGYGIFGKLVR